MIKVRTDLHDLKDKAILTQKGKGKAIYYVPGEELIKLLPVQEETDGKPTQLDGKPTQLPDELKEKINQTGQNYRSAEDTITIILELCDWTDLSLNQLAAVLNKNEKYLKNTYVTPSS